MGQTLLAEGAGDFHFFLFYNRAILRRVCLYVYGKAGESGEAERCSQTA